jgi:hypothetical protein
VRLTAKLDLIDGYCIEHGLLRLDGEPQPALRLYVSIANSARLALVRLEQRMTACVPIEEPLAILEAEGRRIRERFEAP